MFTCFLNVLTPPPPRFRVINGLLLPGGGAVLRPGHAFFDTASALVDLALAANDAGDYFPVSDGVCE
jgi:gamma-glutamyl hydrolase